jgi:hypothetical protein
LIYAKPGGQGALVDVGLTNQFVDVGHHGKFERRQIRIFDGCRRCRSTNLKKPPGERERNTPDSGYRTLEFDQRPGCAGRWRRRGLSSMPPPRYAHIFYSHNYDYINYFHPWQLVGRCIANGNVSSPKSRYSPTRDEQVRISGLVMISPLIDRAAFVSDEDPLHWAIYLPSYAAVMREKAGPVSRAQLADVEQYAAGDYVRDFLQGPSNAAAVSRMVANVTALTGLDATLAKQFVGRIDNDTFLRAIDHAQDGIVSSYDATIAALVSRRQYRPPLSRR